MIIEETIRNYLDSVLDVPVFMEYPKEPPDRFILVEKTGGGSINHLASALFALQSYGQSLYEAAVLNSELKQVMANFPSLPQISRATLNSDYNFTDTSTKEYRYQAVYDINYYAINSEMTEDTVEIDQKDYIFYLNTKDFVILKNDNGDYYMYLDPEKEPIEYNETSINYINYMLITNIFVLILNYELIKSGRLRIKINGHSYSYTTDDGERFLIPGLELEDGEIVTNLEFYMLDEKE